MSGSFPTLNMVDHSIKTEFLADIGVDEGLAPVAEVYQLGRLG